jgi:hypothetical protein
MQQVYAINYPATEKSAEHLLFNLPHFFPKLLLELLNIKNWNQEAFYEHM